MTDKQKSKTKNPVAKNASRFNKPAVHKDRKKSDKKGYVKHKGRQDERPSFLPRHAGTVFSFLIWQG